MIENAHSVPIIINLHVTLYRWIGFFPVDAAYSSVSLFFRWRKLASDIPLVSRTVISDIGPKSEAGSWKLGYETDSSRDENIRLHSRAK